MELIKECKEILNDDNGDNCNEDEDMKIIELPNSKQTELNDKQFPVQETMPIIELTELKCYFILNNYEKIILFYENIPSSYQEEHYLTAINYLFQFNYLKKFEYAADVMQNILNNNLDKNSDNEHQFIYKSLMYRRLIISWKYPSDQGDIEESKKYFEDIIDLCDKCNLNSKNDDSIKTELRWFIRTSWNSALYYIAHSDYNDNRYASYLERALIWIKYAQQISDKTNDPDNRFKDALDKIHKILN